ncbi:MAG: methyltransferase [Rhodobacteraceae bacterium]|nr:methyltransferase [Paracoccaceae bacterium]
MDDDALTRDVFLGGRLAIWQPRSGYRAATDPVLMAAAVPARPGQVVLELGCGVGVALLALGRRVPDLALHGVERQADYAGLARRNADENAIAAAVTEADLTDLPAALRIGFDQVMANPPYYRPGSPAARDPGRDAALREETALADWVDVGLRRCREGGVLTMIHLAERLPEILAALGERASAAVRPIAARDGRAAGRILVQARKGGRAPFRLLAPLVMHQGPAHRADGDDFSPLGQAILRDMRALGWSDRGESA